MGDGASGSLPWQQVVAHFTALVPNIAILRLLRLMLYVLRDN